MVYMSLQDALRYLRRREQQIDREIDTHLAALRAREGRVSYMPFIPRTQMTVNDEDVITLEAARALAAWYAR